MLRFFLFLLLLLLLFAVLFVFSVAKDVDTELYERLFLSAGESRTTRIFVDSDPSDDIYTPVEVTDAALFGGENCIFAPLSELPEDLQNAFIAIEDHRFYKHRGIDFLRTGKAAVNYLFKTDERFGGSTITQQLVKNIGGERDVSITRKLKEMIRAVHLERKHSKEEILEAYLNIVPLSRHCVGVSAAARTYFDKDVSDLSLLECVTIAAITNSPARYDPISHPENNAKRRKLILDAMYRYGYISEAQYLDASVSEPILKKGENSANKIQSWYTDTVIADVIRDLCEKKGYTQEAASKLVYSGGLSIYTLMDPAMQNILETYFSDLSHFPKDQNGNRPAYAMTVIDPKSGNLLATVGNIGKKDANRILSYATDVKRPPGSTTKPLALFAPLIESGKITEATVFDDVPVDFKTNGALWPHNSNRVYSGLTTVRDALRLSKNTTAVRLYRMLGGEEVYDTLYRKLGLDTLVRSGYTKDGKYTTDLAESPLALGQWTYGTTLRAMTNAYLPLAGNGEYKKCRSYSAVYGADGALLLSEAQNGERVFSRETAALVTGLLQDVVENGTAKSIKLKNSVDVAGKTGTSGDYRDRWFIGYTPYLLAGIWCGYPDHTSMASLSPSHLAVWDSVMGKLHKEYLSAKNERVKSFEMPHNLVQVEYCKDSGKLPCEACLKDPRGERTERGWFIKGTEPKEMCDRHVLVPYDAAGGGVAHEGCLFGSLFGDGLSFVGLLSIPERNFPRQVFVSDAQYVARDMENFAPSKDVTQPYFAESIPKGRYVGISMTKDGRQFNAACPEHFLIGEESNREFAEQLPNWDDFVSERYRRNFWENIE